MTGRLGTLTQITNTKGFRLAAYAAAIAATGAVLGYMVLRDWQKLASYSWQVRPLPLVAFFVLYSAGLWLAIVGWHSIVQRLVGSFGFRRNLRYYCYSNLYRRIPGVPWYLVGRAYLYQREGVKSSATIVVSLVETTLLIPAGIVAYFALQQISDTPTVLPVDPRVALATFVVALALVHPATITRLARLLHWPQAPTQLRWVDTWAWLALYVVTWIVGGLALHSLINVVYPLSWASLPNVMAAWVISGVVGILITLTPGGLGIRDVTLAVLLQTVVPPAVAVIVTILVRISGIFFDTLWAMLATRV